ncbi:CHAT domain-containing protein [Cyanobacterium aponinum]|uniref:Filamentous hemagglutinin family outer membrane protein n=1 Tax=Cyanobacterium aponinum (strain PCC 10605) TaxID=755178 RepID=K9Z0T5_CYAAP|nr:CHAT domain-containing protein [Cyanobacterium aponinum]AFZ52811.1 filamentous hemagglutinin family outer membrane protein [Cyanobacterium aponinum PCC 10605]
MWKKSHVLISLLFLIFAGNLPTAQAQEIKIDGNTATIVTRDGNQITIDGNTLSKDGKNLFHSFQEFGLTPQQIATFLTNPNIQNILTRVTGGNPSYIQGLIEVTGGNSNLFLMNPAGIVFGEGASLNVPADFIATTATGIGFANGMFNAVGENDYQNLMGNPNSFVFNTNKSGSIINAGDLAVAEGQNLTLIGSNVINTGTIETPNGKINIQAVEGTSRIKITPEGSLLSLEVDIPVDEQGNLLGFTPQDLPTLLTGAKNSGVVTDGVALNPNTKNVEVSGIVIPNESGLNIVSGELNTSSQDLGGEITLLGDKVAVIDAQISASGVNGGGEIKIGGDFQGSGTIPNASLTVINSESKIEANAFDKGDGGEVIIWSDGDTYFTGVIEAKGFLNGGFVEVSGKENLYFDGKVDTSAVNGSLGTLLLDPENIIVSNDPSNPNDPLIPPTVDGSLPEITLNDFIGQDITINATVLGSQTTNIVLEANNDIDINADVNVINTDVDFTARANRSIRVNNGADIITNGGNITLNSDRDGLNGGSIDIRGVNIDGNLDLSIINANGGDIVLGGGINPLVTPAVGVANQGINPNDRNSGIYLQDASLITDGTGNISLRGSGQAGTGNSNIGIHLVGQTTLQTVDGNINVVGTGEASGELNHGIGTASPEILNDQVIVEVTGLGNIELVGIHEGNGVNGVGIITEGDDSANPTRITSNLGTITLNGLTDASSNTSRGISIQANSQVNSVGGGNINVNAHSINNNDAVGVFDNGAIITAGLTTFDTLSLNNGNGGTTIFPISSEKDISINSNFLSDFASVTLNNGRNVAINDANDVIFNEFSIVGDFTVNATNTSIFNAVNANSLTTGEFGATQLNGNVTTALDQIYNNPVALQADVNLRGNDISFNSTVNSFNSIPRALSITTFDVTGDVSDIGNISFGNGVGDDRIGSQFPLSTLTTTAEGEGVSNLNINLDGIAGNNINSIVAQVDLVYNNPVVLRRNTAINANNNVTFNAYIDSFDIPYDLSVTAGNNINYGNGLGDNRIGAVIGLNNFNSSAEDIFININTIADGNSINTIGDQIYNDPVILQQDTVINTNNLDALVIKVADDSPNIASLRINANDSVTITGEENNQTNIKLGISTARIGGQPAGDISVNASGNIDIDGIVNTTGINQLPPTFASEAGDISITSTNGDVVIDAIASYGTVSSGAVNIAGNNVDLGFIVSNKPDITPQPLPETLGGIITIDGTAITIRGEVTGESLTTNGNLTLINNSNPLIIQGQSFFANSTIKTIGNQDYNGNVTLADNQIALLGNNIDFANAANSETGENNNLTVTANSANFNQAIGNNQLLGDLTLNVSGETQLNQVNSNSLITNESGITQLNGDVTTTGNQTYRDEVIIGDAIAVSGNNIDFANTVNSQTGENNNLTVTSNNVTFNQAIGSNLPLGDITLNISGETQLNQVTATSLDTDNLGTTVLNGDVATTRNQTYGDEVIVGDEIALSGNNIDFANTVNSQTGENNNLTVRANNVNFGDGLGNDLIGGVASLNRLIVTSPIINININTPANNSSIRTMEGQTYTGKVNTLLDTTLTSTRGNLNFNNLEASDNRDLTLESFSSVNFLPNSQIIGKGGDLTIQNNSDRTTIIDNSINRGDLLSFNIRNLGQVEGFDNIIIGTEKSGRIDVNQALVIRDPLTLRASEINVNENINGNGNASVTIEGSETTTTLNANITTQGNAITIDDNVILGDDIILSTNSARGSADIDILGTIDGNHDLTLNANGSNILIEGAIGSSQILNNLETNSSLVTLDGNSVSTNNSQIFNSDLQLGKNISFNTPDSFRSGNINSDGTNLNISAQTITTENINTQGGDVTLNAKSDIQVSTINTSNPQQGGDVEITTLGNFQATGIENGTSINTSGGNGGAVTIDLFPGDLENEVREDSRLPFIIGDASENGTAGLITNSRFTLGRGEYFITTTEGNLTLRLLNNLPSFINNTQVVQETPITPTPEIALSSPPIPIATIDQAKEILTAIEREAAEKPALIYVSFTPKGYQPQDLEAEFARREATNTQEYSRVNINQVNLQPSLNIQPTDEDQLDILVVTKDEKPLRIVVPINRKQVVETAGNLWATTSDVFALDDSYKPHASDMYDWLIKPLEKELEAREISNLLFILPTDMRFIPVAALYDRENQQFLVEKYSSGLAPSLNLNDNRYRPIKDLSLLAMGASEFADDSVVPLPAASLELPSIRKVWTGETPENYQEYLNENFTLEQVRSNLNSQAFGIVHFGTHGDFNPSETDESFLQLYDSRLNITEMRRLGLDNPLVDLMVLSACETAFGNEVAELGFAGLAVQAGVKTALGSVWQVSDTGTLALMTDFYSKLKNTTTKAEALRQAQLDMLKGKVYKTSDGNTIVTPNLDISLEDLPDTSRFPEDFSHPFYWAPFTMIGNPW